MSEQMPEYKAGTLAEFLNLPPDERTLGLLNAMDNAGIEDGFVVIRCPGKINGSYDFPLAECKTAIGLADWLDHLTEKTWVDFYLLMAIIRKITAALREKEQSMP